MNIAALSEDLTFDSLPLITSIDHCFFLHPLKLTLQLECNTLTVLVQLTRFLSNCKLQIIFLWEKIILLDSKS